MIVRFFLAFAVALHRIATTLRIVAIESQNEQHRCAVGLVGDRSDAAEDAIIAAQSLAVQLHAEYHRTAIAYHQCERLNRDAIARLKSSVL